MSKNDPAERTVRDIRRKTRKQYTAEEKIRIVVSGLRGEESIAVTVSRVRLTRPNNQFLPVSRFAFTPQSRRCGSEAVLLPHPAVHRQIGEILR